MLFWERISEHRGLRLDTLGHHFDDPGPYFDTRELDFNSFLELRSAGPVGTLARFLEKVAV